MQIVMNTAGMKPADVLEHIRGYLDRIGHAAVRVRAWQHCAGIGEPLGVPEVLDPAMPDAVIVVETAPHHTTC